MKKRVLAILLLFSFLNFSIIPANAGSISDFFGNITQTISQVSGVAQQIAGTVSNILGNEGVQNLLQHIFPSQSAQNVISQIGSVANIISNVGLNAGSIAQIISQVGSNSPQVQQALSNIANGAGQISQVSNQILQVVSQLAAGSQSAGNLLNQISNLVTTPGAQQFIQNLQQFNQNFQQVLGNAGELAEGTGQMADQVSNLANGILSQLGTASDEKVKAVASKIMDKVSAMESLMLDKTAQMGADSEEMKKIMKIIAGKLIGKNGNLLGSEITSAAQDAKVIELEKQLAVYEAAYRRGVLEENKTEKQMEPIRNKMIEIRRSIFRIRVLGEFN